MPEAAGGSCSQLKNRSWDVDGMATVGAPELGEQCGCLGGWYSLAFLGDMSHRPDRERCERTEKAVFTPPTLA